MKEHHQGMPSAGKGQHRSNPFEISAPTWQGGECALSQCYKPQLQFAEKMLRKKDFTVMSTGDLNGSWGQVTCALLIGSWCPLQNHQIPKD